MKRLFIGALCGACLLGLFLPDRCAAQKFRNDYYDTRRAAHDEEALPSGAVVFLGNSITEQGWWNVLFRDPKVVNRGIGGDNTFGMLDRLPGILAAQPSKIFLMAGINDITGGQSTETIAANIARMADMVHAEAPACRLYVQSVLPVSTKRLAYPYMKGHNARVAPLNERLRALCAERGWCTFVDLVPLVSDADGELRKELTKDGIHLQPAAYMLWRDHLRKQKYLR
ncbi:GDSL-type esterase/lipase family protein [Alistipes sp.]|uniref:GDSL-type esterase/lipase family protein n=1 Tax=Alistipes sp. TaxID=1872444 RepID=UPI000ED27935|nr:GDSL-type esterase/lipase family protein [Alistipes sp.]HCN13305.1 GDSL family lipase [Alistipes sp.]